MAQIKTNLQYGVTGSLQTGSIAGDAIDGTKIADDAINSEHLAAGGIDTAHIADDQITLAKMAAGTDGNIITYDASGNPAVVAVGTSGHFLKSQGAGSVPVFAAAGGGKILQVVSATDSTQVGTTSTSFVTESNNLSVDITPSATSSKIYVVYSTACYFTENTSSLYTTLYRDSTNLGDTNWGLTRLYLTAEDLTTNHMANYLDSPSSTSAITYQVYFRVLAGTGYMISQPKSVITAMEVGA